MGIKLLPHRSALADGGDGTDSGCLSDADTDGDGTPDCEDACSGQDDASYVPDATCGVGYCQLANTPSTCVEGLETACVPAAPLSTDDVTCDGVDDDCDGQVDEDYVATATTCGLGVCAASGELTCQAGAAVDTCVPGAPTASVDDASFPGNGLDDDCNGLVDEDLASLCNSKPTSYEAGAHLALPVPMGCTHVNVQLWGAGGGSGGKTSVGTTGTPGRGGAGGYASGTYAVSGAVDLHVGRGGVGCGEGGESTDAAVAGGKGGGYAQAGTAGQDRTVSGGGAGGTSSGGGATGGKGHYGGGGGGGGALAPWPPYPGNGGGGGAASVLLVGGTRVAVAGGGGGGGGSNGSSVGSVGGAGGDGGSVPGGKGSAGGGGGGGVCIGTTVQAGTSGVPYASGSIPADKARGASDACKTGGDGYAIITFTP